MSWARFWVIFSQTNLVALLNCFTLKGRKEMKEKFYKMFDLPEICTWVSILYRRLGWPGFLT
jgi:hypothetical protein